jgi:hypothetical protein
MNHPAADDGHTIVLSRPRVGHPLAEFGAIWYSRARVTNEVGAARERLGGELVLVD